MMRMRQPAFALVLTAALCASAGPLRPGTVPADARWLVHLNVEQLKATTIGTYVLDRLNTREAGPKLAAFQAVFNFDPRQDIRAVTLCGPDNDERNSTVLIFGDYDRDRLVTLLKATDGYSTEQYGDKTIHGWAAAASQAKRRAWPAKGWTAGFVCFHPDNVAVLGKNADRLRAALDVLDRKQRSLAAAAESLPTARARDAVLAVVADFSRMTGLEPKAAVFQQTRTIELYLRETNGMLEGRFRLLAEQPGTAVQVRNVFRGLIDLALLGAQDNPALA